MQPKGTMVVDDGDSRTELTFRRVYRHRIEHVWDAIATPEGLRAWLMATEVKIEARTGGRFEMVSGPTRFHSTGQILVWEPPRVLEYEWNVGPVPEMPKGERAIVRYELEPRGDATHVVITYRGLTLDTSRGFLPGLHAFLDRLEAQLDESALPGFFERFEELRAEYPEWSHATAAGE